MTKEQKVEQIKLALQTGHWVRVDTDVLFIHYQEGDSDPFFGSGDWKYDEEDIPPDANFEIIPRPRYQYKVGDKVKVVYARGVHQRFVGREGVVTTIGRDDDDINVDFGDEYRWFPEEWLCPIIEDEIETVEISLEELAKKAGLQGKKIKLITDNHKE